MEVEFDDGTTIFRDEGLVRGKHLMDGATTLSEAAQMLREAAEILEGYEIEGWQLEMEIADDYGTFVRQ